jgi:DNA-binding CsgD family transcriptional regulator
MLLKAAYRSAGRTPINIRAQSATGWCLHPRFTDHLEVRQWIQPPYMTDRQITVLELIAKDDLFTDEIAKRLHVSERTVKRDKHAALQTLIRLAWGEPDYVLPPAPR